MRSRLPPAAGPPFSPAAARIRASSPRRTWTSPEEPRRVSRAPFGGHRGSQGVDSGLLWSKVGQSGSLNQPQTMLLGAHEHTIDDKNRLTLPAKFRQAFADGIVVTRGLDGCLFAYRREDWDRLVEH